MKRKRKILYGFLGLLILISLILGARYLYWVQFEYRFTTITEGKMYKSGAMAPEALKRKVREHNIRTVIDFRGSRLKADIDAEHDFLTSLNIRHINIPSKQVPNDTAINRFLSVMDDPGIYPVLIHCEHGYGRANLFSALYRIEFEGWDNESARKKTRYVLFGSAFSLGSPKGDFLANYDPRLR